MPIYLIRWPDLSASLVRAQDEDGLQFVLDEVGDPGACEWRVYDGPLFIDVQLPDVWRREGPEHPGTSPQEGVAAEDPGPLELGADLEGLELVLAHGDTGTATGTEVMRLAFPHLHAALETLFESDQALEGTATSWRAELRAALRREMERELGGSWGSEEGNGGPPSGAGSAIAVEAIFNGGGAGEGGARRRQEAASTEPTAGEGVSPAAARALFRASNHHGGSNGHAPAVDGDLPQHYVGYFANRHGEQAVFVFDQATGEATVALGDTGWEDAFPVVDGRVQGPVVDEAEALWIRACWLASGAGRGRP